MNSVNRRDVMKLAAAAGAVALTASAAQPADPLQDEPKGNRRPVKRAQGNKEPVKHSTATAEHYGPRELFAVVDSEGNLKRGLHVVSSQCLDLGLYEVIFNRDYQPLWSRRPGQSIEGADPKEWVEGIVGEADYFWVDGRGTDERGLRLLREWGISAGRPETLEETPEA